MYVFGINLPIMEILFIFMVMLTIALVFLLLEVRKLRLLLLEEEVDIGRFEADILKLEGKNPANTEVNKLEQKFEELLSEVNNNIIKNNMDKAIKSYRKLYDHFKNILNSAMPESRKKEHYQRALDVHKKIIGANK